MSSEEDTSLRDLVDQTLTASGVLPKIKAELRANVFLALENNPDISEKLTLNKELSAFSKTEKGSIVLNLIREFLQYFNLEFTLAVFEPETCCGSTYTGACRQELLKKLKVNDSNQRAPLLCDLLDLNGTGGQVESSPGLNATYVKNESSFDTTPIKRNTQNHEEKQRSRSPSEGSSEESPKTPEERRHSSSGNSHSNVSTPPNDNLSESVNLLVFTPVHDVKAVPKAPKEKNELQSDDFRKQRQRPEAEGKADTCLQESKSIDDGIKTLEHEHSTLSKLIEEQKRKSKNAASSLGQQENTSFSKSTDEAVKTKLLEREKIIVEMRNKNASSSLGDLPPLPGVGKSSAASLSDLPPMGVASKQKNMKHLRGLMDGMQELSDDLNSLSSKSSLKVENGRSGSPDSQRTITSEEVDEDISELLNSHGSSDAATGDETVSRLSNYSGIDYMETV